MSTAEVPSPADHDRPRIPLALSVVAWLNIAIGVGAVLDIADSLARHGINFDFGVVCLFMGWGLLRLDDTWRGFALFWTGLVAILLVSIVMLVCVVAPTLSLCAFGHEFVHVADMPTIWSAIWSAAVEILALLLLYWQYRVLTRPDVRALFRRRFRRRPSDASNVARPRSIPVWFIMVVLALAIAQYVFTWAAEKKKLVESLRDPAPNGEVTYIPGFVGDSFHNMAIVDDKTNAIRIAANMPSSCIFNPGTDDRGRRAYISPATPKPIVWPMVENTMAIQFADGTKMEFPLRDGAAEELWALYHGPQGGYWNSLLRRALGLLGPSEQRSRLMEFLAAYHEREEPRPLAVFDDSGCCMDFKMTANQAQATSVELDKDHALQITTDAKAQWPSVLVEPKSGKWDLSDFDAATVDIQNPEDAPVRVLMNVNNPGADGQHHCNTDAITVPAHGKATLTVPFGSWYGDPSHPIDLTNVVSVSIGLDRPGKSRRFLITRIQAVEFDHSQIDAALADPFFQTLKPVFGRGINLGNALEAPKEGDWGVTLKEPYFEKIAAAGFDSVRIPVCWSAHAAESPPYTIDPKFFDRVDWAVNQALRRKLIPIVDMHHYGGMMDEPEKNRRRFLALWEQITQHYKDFPPQLALELLNEPHNKLTADIWNSILAEGLAVVRRTNPTREIVVGPVGWNAIGELRNLTLPKDDRHLIVTVHYYSPFQFTHQGTEFSGPEAQKWLGRKWTGTKAEQQAVERDLDTAIVWAVKNRRPLYLGEFGVYHKADEESRATWIRFVADEAVKRKMGFAYWEFCSGFGIYDPSSDCWLEPLKNALIGSSPAK